MDTEDQSSGPTIADVIELMCDSMSGGTYKLKEPVYALFDAILETHLQQCIDTERANSVNYKATGRYTYSMSATYHKHVAKYLGTMRESIKRGYKRTVINDKVQRILLSLSGEVDNAGNLSIRNPNQDCDGTDKSREESGGDRCGHIAESNGNTSSDRLPDDPGGKKPRKRRNSGGTAN